MAEICIENPCTESWKKMASKGEGRHCSVCNLMVVDFTQKTEQEILEFFSLKNGHRVCGRYRNDQVETPQLRRRRKNWNWFIAALTFLFGTGFISSCRKHVTSGRTQGAAVIFDFRADGNQQPAKNYHGNMHHTELH